MVSKATLQSQSQDFVDDLMEFSSASMEWCARESERAASQVSEAIHFLLADAKRISSMSAEAVALLQALRAKTKDPKVPTKTAELIASLQKLRSEEADVLKFADPVIEALQFQDRITQNMENMARMIAVWSVARSQSARSAELSSTDRAAFGRKLLECTTMLEERDAVRAQIPELPPEEKVKAVTMF